MAANTRIHWIRVALAILATEALPVLLLVLVVVVYELVRQPESPLPHEFAPRAGNWVGPIGGFLATVLFSYWVARRVTAKPFAHGAAVGIGTAILDLVLRILVAGQAPSEVFFVSNVGRILAGVLGGWLGSRRGSSAPDV